MAATNFDNLPRFRTLGEMFDYTYGEVVKKADDPALSTTSGFVNARYGMELFSSLSQEANAFGVLPQFAYNRKGFRAITANEATTASAAENGAWAETDKPDVTEVSVALKNVRTPYDISLQEMIYEGQDDTIANADLHKYYAERHKSAINGQLMSTNGTVASTNFESLDRICGSYLEVSTYTDAANAAYDANDLDIYSQNRDAAASWVDAYVSGATSDRSFSLDMLLDAFGEVEYYQGETQVILTGKGTFADMEKAANAYVRYNMPGGALKEAFVSLGVNGVTTNAGIGVGTRTSAIYGVPMIKSKDTVTETSGSERIYGLDTKANPLGTTPKLGLKMGMLPKRFVSEDVLANDNLAHKFGYATIAELQCEIFRHQFKIRDLS